MSWSGLAGLSPQVKATDELYWSESSRGDTQVRREWGKGEKDQEGKMPGGPKTNIQKCEHLSRIRRLIAKERFDKREIFFFLIFCQGLEVF